MDRAQTSYVGRLQRLPAELATHPALLFSPSTEGYRDYAFGCKSGPHLGVEHLFHELAHAAEFGGEAFDERATPTGYLLRSRRIWIFDRFCEEPLTMGAIERELRTFAHQHHLLALTGQRHRQKAYFHECARLMQHMADWIQRPRTHRRSADRVLRHAHRLAGARDPAGKHDPKAQGVARPDAAASCRRERAAGQTRGSLPRRRHAVRPSADPATSPHRAGLQSLRRPQLPTSAAATPPAWHPLRAHWPLAPSPAPRRQRRRHRAPVPPARPPASAPAPRRSHGRRRAASHPPR